MQKYRLGRDLTSAAGDHKGKEGKKGKKGKEAAETYAEELGWMLGCERRGSEKTMQ
jgi:hypothetical protein